MRIIFLTIAIIILSQDISGIERKSLLRFHRILREYDHPDFKVCDRDIDLDIEYGAKQDDSLIPNALTIANIGDFYKKYSMDFTGTTSFIGRQIKSSPTLQLDHSITALITGEIGNETVLSGNELLNVSDTSVTKKQNLDVLLKYSCGIRRYALLRFLPRNLFIELSGILDVEGIYTYENKMASNQVQFNSYNWFEKGSCIDGTITLSPNIGYGKRHPIAPVYKAFEIERKLKKNGTLRSSLSDSSLLELSNLIGSVESFKVSHDRSDKFIMRELERIIRADSACDSSTLDAFALFKAFETFSEPFPLLFHGFEIKFLSSYELNTRYGFDIPSHNSDPESFFDLDFDYYTLPHLQLEWTVPLTSRIFPQIGIQALDHWRSRGPYYSEGNIGIYFMVTNSIVAYVSATEIPLYISLPNDFPEKVELKVDFFLEDHVSLTLYGFKRFREIVSTNYEYFGMTNHAEEMEGISLKANYDF